MCTLVRAHMGCISTRSSESYVLALKYGDVFNAMFFSQIVRCGETMDSTADDDYVIVTLERPGLP